MSNNYNSTLQSNNTDLQEVLQTLQTKAANGEQATPEISVDSNGLITATAGTKSATKQLTTQVAKMITPSTSSQTAVAKNVYTTGVVTVNPIPSNYIVPSGTKTITTNGTHDVKSYASATVNVAGENVTDETTAYTEKLAALETAITALETELQGKANGGSGGSNIETCTVVIQKDASITDEGFFNVIYQYLSDSGNVETGSYFCVNTDSSLNGITGEEGSGLPLTLNNIVCGNFMCFHAESFWCDNFEDGVTWKDSNNEYLTSVDSDGGTLIYTPTNANSTETITIAPYEEE